MPYHKDNQQAFQAAQQGYVQAKDAFREVVKGGSDFGHELAHLKQEVNEAYQQIENALEVASEHQRQQLEQFKQDLSGLLYEVNGGTNTSDIDKF
ncbi:hypothetical protein GCM10008967_02050 [Bacillus carboniphilus]|uniref:Small, acid-soluble spore protein N n=1 Tax=Bacillus carboniphilus TaxID=86663 RepID=A0ABN0VRP6_9BACI